MRFFVVFLAALLALRGACAAPRVFRAGAAEVDITPKALPIAISGNFFPAYPTKVRGRLCVRAIVLDDGSTRLAIAVADTLMMPRELLDRTKLAASRTTGIAPERMMISATHTHSAPPAMGALGTDPVPEYVAMMEASVAQAIAGAARNLAPAEVGWTSVDVPDHTHCRRWILRPDKMRKDPFGGLTVRAHMHPGFRNPDFIGPAGPSDPELSLVAFRARNGRPIALLANYSMHYVGERGGAVAPDYFGDFSELLTPEAGVAIMSQGTAGDQHWMDYSRPKQTANPSKYAEEMAAITRQALRGVRYQGTALLGMLETEVELSRRAPDQARLKWARDILARLGEAPPRTTEQVYAREQIILHDEPSRKLKLQALRIGDLGIAVFPAEVFAITGLKIKSRSPFSHTFNVELANGAEGYIPPPEQHALGGYTTWPARTAALEPNAEPLMAEQLLGMLERLRGTRRRTAHEPLLETAQAVLRSKPLAYWPMDDMEGTRLRDASRNGYAAEAEGSVALYLDGHTPRGRAIHFAGGRMRADLPLSGDRYTVEFWFWNGMPTGMRPVTGYLFSRGEGDRLALDGEGRLIFENGGRTLRGEVPLVLCQWYHLKLNRTKNTATILLNDEPVLRGEVGLAPASRRLWYGGCNTAEASFEGKLDDIAVWAR
jgi:hypothetical protein